MAHNDRRSGLLGLVLADDPHREELARAALTCIFAVLQGLQAATGRELSPSTLSTASRVRSSESGHKCEYVFSVSIADA